MGLTDARFLDLVVVATCTLFLVAKGGLRHSHIAVIYIGFHLLVFSLRAYGVDHGGETYFGTTTPEIVRALLYADGFLIAATIGWLTVPKDRRHHDGASRQAKSWTSFPIRGDAAVVITLLAAPVSIFTLINYSRSPSGIDNSQSLAGYMTMPSVWLGACLGMLAYKYGIRWLVLVPMTVYGLVVVTEGVGRYRIILPAILLLQIYLDRKDRRWPSLRVIVLFIVMFFAFFPMKDLAQAHRTDASRAEMIQVAKDSMSLSAKGQDSGQRILDQFASVLTLTDNHGSKFWGEPYVNSMLIPVPRSIWSEKPTLADHLVAISSPSRPLAQNGAVATMPGDLYLNFGLAGVLLGGFALARLSGRAFFRAYRDGYGTPTHFAYLLLAASSVQVLRDGLVSLVTFTFIKNFPVVLFLVVCWMLRPRADATEKAEDRGPNPPRRTRPA